MEGDLLDVYLVTRVLLGWYGLAGDEGMLRHRPGRLGESGGASAVRGRAAPMEASRCARSKHGMFSSSSWRAAAQPADEGPSMSAHGRASRYNSPRFR